MPLLPALIDRRLLRGAHIVGPARVVTSLACPSRAAAAEAEFSTDSRGFDATLSRETLDRRRPTAARSRHNKPSARKLCFVTENKPALLPRSDRTMFMHARSRKTVASRLRLSHTRER